MLTVNFPAITPGAPYSLLKKSDFTVFIECIRSESLSQRCVVLAKSMVCLCWHLHEVTVVQATKMGA